MSPFSFKSLIGISVLWVDFLEFNFFYLFENIFFTYNTEIKIVILFEIIDGNNAGVVFIFWVLLSVLVVMFFQLKCWCHYIHVYLGYCPSLKKMHSIILLFSHLSHFDITSPCTKVIFSIDFTLPENNAITVCQKILLSALSLPFRFA